MNYLFSILYLLMVLGKSSTSCPTRRQRSVLCPPVSFTAPSLDDERLANCLLSLLRPILRHHRRILRAKTSAASDGRRRPLVLGLNAACRRLESGQLAAVLLDQSCCHLPVMTSHMASVAAHRNTRMLIVPGLRRVVTECCDFPSTAVGLNQSCPDTVKITAADADTTHSTMCDSNSQTTGVSCNIADDAVHSQQSTSVSDDPVSEEVVEHSIAESVIISEPSASSISATPVTITDDVAKDRVPEDSTAETLHKISQIDSACGSAAVDCAQTPDKGGFTVGEDVVPLAAESCGNKCQPVDREDVDAALNELMVFISTQPCVSTNYNVPSHRDKLFTDTRGISTNSSDAEHARSSFSDAMLTYKTPLVLTTPIGNKAEKKAKKARTREPKVKTNQPHGSKAERKLSGIKST